MSTPLLLPYSPSLQLRTDSRNSSLNKAPPLLHISSFGNCQGLATKTPLLKSRRNPHIPPLSSHRWLPFATSPSSKDIPHVSTPQRKFLLKSNIDEDFPSSEEFEQLHRGVIQPQLFERSPPVRIKPLGGGFSSSDSLVSLNPLSPLTPSSSPLLTSECPASPQLLSQSSSSLRKSQSTLIMPNIFTFLRQESLSPTGIHGLNSPEIENSKILRDSSFMSLKDKEFSSPLPPIQKSQTVVALSNSQGSIPHTVSKISKGKKSSRLRLFDRFSHSSQGQSIHPFRKASTNSMLSYMDQSMRSNDLRTEGNAIVEEVQNTLQSCSRCNSVTSLASRGCSSNSEGVFCKLCLTEVTTKEIYQLQQCQCRFCTYCMRLYTTHKIYEGDSIIECPDSNCDCRGTLCLPEIESLVGKELFSRHLKLRRDRDVNLDPYKIWCPRPGCDTVVSLRTSKIEGRPQCTACPTCTTFFCASCSMPWHPSSPCTQNTMDLENTLSGCIKWCPRCKVPIERDEGCAQMQCKKCKHVFCWYCLASLEDDFLLRHYDKGPCKNKLGHSRASVLLHRTQVVAIFAGFCILMMIASPLFLIIGPCILCRSCSSFCKANGGDEDGSSV